MTREEHTSFLAEVTELEALLAETPSGNVIDRMGLEARLQVAKKIADTYSPDQLPRKARLTFRGHPVFGSRAVSAEFGAKAATFFTDAFSAIVAGIAENLQYMGPIPDKQKNQLLLTGTAIGSFGFEFELPKPAENIDPKQEQLFPVAEKTEEAMEKLERLFELSASGTDDDVAELVVEIHPRAVKKAAEFLEYVSEHDAWCGLEFKERIFRYSGVEQIRASAERLKSSNIKESDGSFEGEFQGVLPKGRTFEFKIRGEREILRGKIGPDIADPDVLNRDYLHKSVAAQFHVIQVGQGRPRYTLGSLADVKKA